MDIDARGPRFGAIITTVVLALALATTSVWLLLAQALVFAVAAYRRDAVRPVRPRVPLADRARAWGRRRGSSRWRHHGSRRRVGLVFCIIGVIGYAVGLTGARDRLYSRWPWPPRSSTAAFDFCLGCQMYLIIRRIRPSQRSAAA
jgi:hypothetical protein